MSAHTSRLPAAAVAACAGLWLTASNCVTLESAGSVWVHPRIRNWSRVWPSLKSCWGPREPRALNSSSWQWCTSAVSFFAADTDLATGALLSVPCALRWVFLCHCKSAWNPLSTSRLKTSVGAPGLCAHPSSTPCSFSLGTSIRTLGCLRHVCGVNFRVR